MGVKTPGISVKDSSMKKSTGTSNEYEGNI